MTQTRLESFIEVCISTLIGYAVAVASQVLIFPWFGIHIPLSSNLWIGVWFTGISLLRGYILRRYFNARMRRAIHRVTSTSPLTGGTPPP